jgi:hypothetical protein
MIKTTPPISTISPVDEFYIEYRKTIAAEEAHKQYLASLTPKERKELKKKRGRPRTKKYYFDIHVENAILAYVSETDQNRRDRVYRDFIYKAFDKLAENIIHTFKFYYMDGKHSDVKHEVVAFLIEKMPKFTKGKGKAFSYFSIVAKNYLIINNNKQYARMKQKAAVIKIDTDRNVTNEIHREDRITEIKDFFDEFIEYWEAQLFVKFSKSRDRQIADALLELFRIRDNIENFNKKALYIMIREMTGVKTLYITKVVNTIKRSYQHLYPLYAEYGSLFRIPPKHLK